MAENVIGEAFIALKASFDEFRKEMGLVQQEVEKAVAPAQKKFQELGKSLGDVGKQMSLKVTAPIVAVGAAAFKAGDTIDDAMHTIRTGTGATGKALEELGEDFKAVFKEVPQDAGQVSTAIADLNTRLGLTGQPLQELTTQMLNLARISGTEVGPLIASTTRLFGDWSVATEKQGDTLDYLWKVSQSTGIGVDTLAQKMVQFGAPLRQMGFDFETAAALMGKWEKEGVNAELVLGSLRIAMGNFARENIPLREGLDQTIKKIQELGPGAEATALAMEVFGARAGPDMAAAILEGRFAVDELLQSIQASPETVNSASDDIKGFGEAMGEMRNQITLALEPLGKTLLEAFEKLKPHLEKAIEFVTKLVEKFADLDPKWQTVILAAAGFLAALGPVLAILGPIISTIGTLIGILPALGTAFAALTGPIGLVVAAIAGAIAIGVLLYTRWDEIKTWLGNTWNSIKNKAVEVWGAISGFLAEKWETIKKWASEKWGGIQNTITSSTQSAAGWLGQKWNEVQASLGNIWEKIKTLAGEKWEGVKSIIKGVINGIINFINRFIRYWNNIEISVPQIEVPFVGSFGGWTIRVPQIPEIPTLATGGIVTRPTLALLGETGPEAVLPLRDTRATGIVIHNINIYGNSADEIWEKFNRELARRGVRF